MALIPGDVHAQLVERRQRIESLAGRGARDRQLEHLISEIDDAIARLSAGTYGRCETCQDPIETELLEADPLTRFCIDHLTPREARALEQDLELASRVQLNLLPPSQLEADGWQLAYHYEPFTTVSGDYVDIVRPTAGDGQLLFLLGDIAGKGVAASMLMAHLHASVRTLIDLGFALPQVVERANRIFCESTMANHYATLVCGRLSTEGELELCNAGHCPPIHLHDGHASTIDPTSVPVGLFCVKEFPSRKVQLAPGDALLLYTDGVTEAQGADESEYGLDRLVSAATGHSSHTASALVDACMRDLERFRGVSRRLDDVTIMAIKRL